MLYIITLALIFFWMVLLIRKRELSWHSIVAAYAITVFIADMLEVTFNLLLGRYKFPAHLSANPIADNELGIIFADTLILPFAFIVFVHYAAKKYRPWKTSLPFAMGFTILEWIFKQLGYLKYLHWNLILSAVFYVIGFRIGAWLAPRIASYNPPVPYWARLFCFSHTIIMWVGALFASPLLMMYQYKPGIFSDPMADCRFTDLLSGDALSLLCALFIPWIPEKAKPFAFASIALIGIAFALFSYNQGWLAYHQWNHFFMALRYIVPLAIVMLYDRWEMSFQNQATKNV